MSKAAEILGLIEERKGITLNKFAELHDLSNLEAKEILDYGIQQGLLYETKNEEYDVRGASWEKYCKGDHQGFKEFEKFINKYFGNLTLKKKIAQFTGKRNLAQQFLNINPLFYDGNKLWWMWDSNTYSWNIIDETDILNAINSISKADTISSKEKGEIIEALKQEARKGKPEDPKESWVQFKDRIYDLETGEELIASPKYFISNPINWEVGVSDETPEMDKLFISWVGEEHKDELYEILAFSIVPSYFIHRIFCLIGSGANGKSTYLKILEKFVDEENITSSSLNLLLKERFEGSKLLKKLVCLIGETNFNIINNTDFLKKLTGQDMIRCEFKGKDIFDFRNYAKLIMATNSLPPTGDKTEGFYRRWKIIDFPNQFDVEKDVLSSIPEEEYENLAFKCLRIVKRLWKERIFTNDGDFEKRKKRYEEKANPLMIFIRENYNKDSSGNILFSEFKDDLIAYLEESGHRILSAPAISKQLKNEGFDIRTKTIEGVNAKFIEGITQMT